MMFDLVPLWAAILGLGIFMYVLLDGFDLGVGILFPFAPDDRSRDLMMASVAPVWDGNETWLVLGGIGLYAAFPSAFAIIAPALYFPLLIMLTGLILRGVAFEFRGLTLRWKPLWSRCFFVGSLLATFAQGVVLGAYVAGFAVEERRFVGGNFDWLAPFPLLTGIGLVCGYGLLGASWLVLKTEGELQQWARGKAKPLFIGVLAFVAMVSIWTPLADARTMQRWFSLPNFFWLLPLPLATLLLAVAGWRALHGARRELTPFLCAMGLFVTCYLGLVVSLWPDIVPHALTLHEAAAAPNSQAFLLLGTLFLLPFIFLYTAWSYWVFRGKVRDTAAYH